MEDWELNEIQGITSAILNLSRKSGFSGRDPFDGLNSKLFKLFPSLKRSAAGIAWIQFFKRSPVDFRGMLGVPKGRNPKGIGLFILGLLEDYNRTKDPYFLHQAIGLADWLLTQQCDKTEWGHSCWGYHFDWNSRAFFVQKGKPNAITTVYVAQALYALANIVDIEKYRVASLDAAYFVVKTLYTESEGRSFFAYVPGETAFVHNASLWSAAWVAVAGADTDSDKHRELALKVARQSVAEQREDGSWVYGARNHHHFIDGFHTGYNLEALDLIRRSLVVSEFDDAIDRGFAYYTHTFFEDDGTAKYYSESRYPLDMHSVSQAVLTLLKVGGTEEGLRLAEKVIQRSIDTLYMPSRKRFVYQKTRWITNRINYMRWTQAWVYYSFATYINYVSKSHEEN